MTVRSSFTSFSAVQDGILDVGNVDGVESAVL